MSKKLSLYVGAPLERLLAERQSDMQQPTTLLNAIADRYLQIIWRNIPDLTAAEWSLVFDALNGIVTWDSAQMLASLYAHVEDAIRRDRLSEKWRVDGPALIQKLRTLSYCEAVTLADVAERFWARFGDQPVAIAEALQQLGVTPVETAV